MPRPVVALLTESRYADPPAHRRADPYVANILLEDAIVARALDRVGLAAERIDWAEFDAGRGYAAALFRTTWDYFDRWPAFARFLETGLGGVPAFNPLPLVRWNTDKHYLLELAAAGVAVPPTCLVERGSELSLAGALEAVSADEAVVKPCISGAARNTRRILRRAPGFEAHAAWFRASVAQEAMIVQPFVPEILTAGEVSVVVFDGRATHAVRKRARPGDYRVQDDHGGTVEPCPLSPGRAGFALEVLRAAEARCGCEALYARVDFVEAAAGPLLMELELVEPEIFVRTAPEAADVLARGLARRLGGA